MRCTIKEISLKTTMTKRLTAATWLMLFTVTIHCEQSHASDGARQDRMNVLFLAVDDLNTWLLGDANRYTGKVVAPNIQKLADSGVNFVRAYTASPKCSPSRTAILSGVSPWKSGVYQNGVAIEESPALKQATSLPKLFMASGYYTASSGKIGHGWDTREAWHALMRHSRDPGVPNAPLNGWAKAKNGRATEKDWGPIHLPEEEMQDAKYADFAIEQLRKTHERPFFIACGIFHPHFPWYVPQKYLDMFPLDEIVVPEIKDDDLEDVPEAGRALVDGLDERIREHNQVSNAIQGYLASTAFADRQIGRVLEVLADSPYAESTIVVLWSDHGFHLGEKRHWAKGTLWEEGTHSLLMFRVPGMTRAGGTCERFVSLQDIYPTLAELCSIDPPDYMDGRSLVPLLGNPDAEWESTAVTAYDERYLSLRTNGYRYIRYTDGQEELYHCAKDPHEWTNLARNSEYATEIERLRASVPPLSEMSLPMPSQKGKNK